MGRIRTVKPELFTHEGLFEAEVETGLPLRLSFIGLFTCCDREGRFKWRPRVLKLDVLPHDQIDFSRVLDALATRGFVVRYQVDGEDFGVIPTFHRHQAINSRETKSVIPPPPKTPLKEKSNSTRAPRVDDASSTGDPRDEHAARGEGKGREGKGKEESSSSRAREEVDRQPATAQHRSTALHLLDRGKAQLSGWERKFLEDLCRKASITAKMQATLDGIATKIGVDSEAIAEEWRKRLKVARERQQWDAKWGPMPGKPGCFVPDELLVPGDGEGWTEWRAAS